MHAANTKKQRATYRSDARKPLADLQPRHASRLVLVTNRMKSKRKCPLKIAKRRLAGDRIAIGGNRFASLLHPADYLRAAFGTPPSLTVASMVLGVCRPHVARMRCVVASMLLYSQLLSLGIMLMICAADPPLCVITREAWDETTHRFAFKLSGDLPEAQQSSS